MGRTLKDMQIAGLKSVKIKRGGMKYELVLALRSALDSSPNPSVSDLERRRAYMESESTPSKARQRRHERCFEDSNKTMSPIRSIKKKSPKSSTKKPQQGSIEKAIKMKKALEDLLGNLQSIEEQLKFQESLINEMKFLADNLKDGFRNNSYCNHIGNKIHLLF
ncbi:hypothetical protein CDAR_22261 [Caerostris darwini]|uniref:Uncharacterized protein n=1 Tax=Caerostris darwini TaxID=1538125 RepID=A0AAV4USP8_9ARAC|nr:hypothetical protein CDAR_22261 [Caerostris darwini]